MDTTNIFKEPLNQVDTTSTAQTTDIKNLSSSTISELEKSQELKINQDIEKQNKNEKPSTIITNKFKLAIVSLGLVLAIFIAAVDETIVATALGAITTDFKASGEVTWIAGAYLLTMTAFQPLYGKFSDIFGRKLCMLFALIIFLIGSIGCGVATSIIMLIVFRGLSGVGAGGLIALSFIIMSDVVTIEKRSLYMSLINSTFAFSNVIGPLLGGVFVDYVHWRWVFYINIPVVAVTMFAVVFVLPLSKGEGNIKEKLARIDVLGTVTLVFATIGIVLALNWGGKEYSWASAPVIVCLIIGVLLALAFIYIELRYAVEPVIPSRIFTPNVICANIATIFYGFSMFVFMYYWPLYHQVVHHATATKAGIEVLPVLVGICGFAAISGFICSKTGKYRPLMWSGMILLVIGTSLMARLTSEITRAEEILYPLIVGVGIGLNIQTCIICCQAAVEEEDVAVVTAFVSFSLSIGGVLGLAIQGAIFNNILTYQLESLLPDYDIANIMESIANLNALAPEAYNLAISGYLTAYRTMFLSLIPFAGIGLIAVLCTKHIPLVSRSPENQVPMH